METDLKTLTDVEVVQAWLEKRSEALFYECKRRGSARISKAMEAVRAGAVSK